MIKRSLIAVVVLSLFASIVPISVASAHVLKSDGDIGVVLHINPDDNLISGQPTDYILSFQDMSQRFSLPDCLCNTTFIKDGTVVATQPLVVKTNQISEDTYTFPAPGVYTIRVAGTPKHIGDFQPFRLDYVVRASSDASTTQQDFSLSLWVGIGLVMGLVLLATVPAMYADSKNVTNERQKK